MGKECLQNYGMQHHQSRQSCSQNAKEKNITLSGKNLLDVAAHLIHLLHFLLLYFKSFTKKVTGPHCSHVACYQDLYVTVRIAVEKA